VKECVGRSAFGADSAGRRDKKEVLEGAWRGVPKSCFWSVIVPGRAFELGSLEGRLRHHHVHCGQLQDHPAGGVDL